MTFLRTRRVFVGDDDGSGLIYFPMYFQYMSEGDQLLFDALGTPVHEQIRDHVAGPTVHVECDYFAPVRAGDELTHEIAMEIGRRSSITTEHQFQCRGQLVARGRIVRAYVDLETLETVAVPTRIRSAANSDSTGKNHG